MNKEQYKALIAKVSDGTASDAELKLYNRYYNTYQQGEPDWDIATMGEKRLVKEKLDHLILPYLEQATKNSVKTRRLWLRYAGVAAAITGICLCVWFFYAESYPELISGPQNYASDIAPGKNTATLSVNGRLMPLSEAKTGVIISDDIKYNDGSLVKTASGSDFSGRASTNASDTITATTPRGGMYAFVLPDGSRVWLNSESKIRLTAHFSDKQRKVFLEGEAYFEVAKDKKRPFVVESFGQQTTVLGTHFNISAYRGAPIKTTLLEGVVSVRHLANRRDDGNAVILRPNQQAILMAGHVITVKLVNAENAIGWKNGYFIFNDEPVQAVMQQIARWYNVEVVYTGTIPTGSLDGKVSNKRGLSQVLKMLEKTREIRFEVKGNKIYVIN